MFQKFIIFLIIFLIVVIQISAFPNLMIGGVVPNLSLVLIVLWVIREGFEHALPKVLLMGFIFDLMTFSLVGLNMLSFTVIAFVASSFTKRFLVVHKTWRFSMILVLVVIATVLHSAIIVFLMKLIDYMNKAKASGALPVFDSRVFKEIIFNLFLLMLIYVPIKKLERILEFYNYRKTVLK